jgi:hypothetical protein
MLKRNYRNFNSKTLIYSILIVSLPPAFILNITIEVADSKAAGQQAPINTDLKKEACTATKIYSYAKKLGTVDLKESDFNMLVNCGEKAVLTLSQFLKNERAEVRASSVYALGEIGVRKQNLNAIRIIKEYETYEKDNEVLALMRSYEITNNSCITCAYSRYIAKSIKSQTIFSSPIICSLPGIRYILPRCN